MSSLGNLFRRAKELWKSPVPLWAEFLPLACGSILATYFTVKAIESSSGPHGLVAFGIGVSLVLYVKSIVIRWSFIKGPREAGRRARRARPYKIRWGCADEMFAEREFTFFDVMSNGRPAYQCTCGWLQFSPRDGGQKLLDQYPWPNEPAWKAFAQIVECQPDADFFGIS